jgi:hypothetical protein
MLTPPPFFAVLSVTRVGYGALFQVACIEPDFTHTCEQDKKTLAIDHGFSGYSVMWSLKNIYSTAEPSNPLYVIRYNVFPT